MDWLCFVTALVGIGFWIHTDNALWAIVAAVVVEIFAFAPTYRKTFLKPYDETVSSYALVVVAVLLSVLALKAYTVTTWLYPLAIVVTNTGFVAFTMIRRSQLRA